MCKGAPDSACPVRLIFCMILYKLFGYVQVKSSIVEYLLVFHYLLKNMQQYRRRDVVSYENIMNKSFQIYFCAKMYRCVKDEGGWL